jgi:hypothetical protein
MPLKDPGAYRLYMRNYTRRRRSDPIKKARQDELRRARYPKIKDRLNAKRREIAAEKTKNRPAPPRKEPPMYDKAAIVKERRDKMAIEAREIVLKIIPKDGTVHRVQDVRRDAKITGPTLQAAIAGTDIQTIKNRKTHFLYRMP